MARDAVATMGDLLPDHVGGRDAVHVAVVSAKAGAELLPGQHVGLDWIEGREEPNAVPYGKNVGIVDPYLKDAVQPNQRFWLYLYPRSITGLSHKWSHPDFPDAKPGEVYAPPSQKLQSETWIRNYADQLGDSYESLMAGADTWVKHQGEWGEYYYGPGEEDGSHGLFEGVSTHPEFWDHYERVRGVKIPDGKRESFFTCSC